MNSEDTHPELNIYLLKKQHVMIKKLRVLVFLPLVFSLVFSSCVSTRKFKASEDNVTRLQKENASQQTKLNDCSMQASDLNNEMVGLKNENAAIQKDLIVLTSESKMTIADQAKRLRDLQVLIQSQKDLMNNLKNSVADALLKYKADELSVYIKDGNVYVSLTDKLLFKSGSDVVNPIGKEALKSLAKVLNDTKDISVLIEGHTDNVPISTSQYKDNWALSTARANSIVRILTKDDGFDPIRITAAGRSQFYPVESNETKEGRASNRRTEIILSPDLKELYNLLYL
jgi:chemotaxis protein MotB